MPQATHEKGATPTWLSEDERRFRASLEGLVDFYRVAQGGVLWRAFWPGALIALPLGSALMALARGARFVPGNLEPIVTMLAIVVIAAGPSWAIFALLRSMRRDDRYLAIFQAGLRICLDASGEPEQVSWDELLDVELRADGALVLVTERGEIAIAVRFAELSLSDLARRIRDAKRLALWGRLTRPTLLGSSAV